MSDEVREYETIGDLIACVDWEAVRLVLEKHDHKWSRASTAKVQIFKSIALLAVAVGLLAAALLSDDVPPPDSHPSWADIDACADALRECRIASSPARYPLCVRISESPFLACMPRAE